MFGIWIGIVSSVSLLLLALLLVAGLEEFDRWNHRRIERNAARRVRLLREQDARREARRRLNFYNRTYTR